MAASGKIGQTERLQLDGVSRREPVTLRRDEHSAGRSMALGARRGAGAALARGVGGAPAALGRERRGRSSVRSGGAEVDRSSKGTEG